MTATIRPRAGAGRRTTSLPVHPPREPSYVYEKPPVVVAPPPPPKPQPKITVSRNPPVVTPARPQPTFAYAKPPSFVPPPPKPPAPVFAARAALPVLGETRFRTGEVLVETSYATPEARRGRSPAPARADRGRGRPHRPASGVAAALADSRRSHRNRRRQRIGARDGAGPRAAQLSVHAGGRSLASAAHAAADAPPSTPASRWRNMRSSR